MEAGVAPFSSPLVPDPSGRNRGSQLFSTFLTPTPHSTYPKSHHPRLSVFRLSSATVGPPCHPHRKSPRIKSPPPPAPARVHLRAKPYPAATVSSTDSPPVSPSF